jgi:hypothetical protein
MRPGALLIVCCLACTAAPDDPIGRILARVSEEAEVFRQMAPRLIARETLVQRALKPPPRFRPRIGQAALQPPKPEYRTREIVSEYAFSNFKDSPGALREFRQIETIDGRKIVTAAKARETLAAGMRNDDERAKRRMIETFEKHGLTGAAADFGQVLLLFARSRLTDYSFTLQGDDRIGADQAVILAFAQHAGSGSLVIFQTRKALHIPLAGELWVRQRDGLPLRVVLRSTRNEGFEEVRDEASVDYVMTPHGVLAPVAVVHREFFAAEMRAENVFRYSPFRLFAAEADIKFTEAPDR